MIVVLCLLIWTLCAVITYGVIKHLYPDEVYGDEALVMEICMVMWPILAFIRIMRAALLWLSKFGEFVGGFLDGVLHDKEEEHGKEIHNRT